LQGGSPQRAASRNKRPISIRHLLSHYDDIPKLYESGEFAEVVRKFVLLADAVNAYIAEKAPWRLAKDEQKRDELHRVCTFALSAFQVLGSMLKPLVPQASTKAEQFLGIEAKYFSDVRSPLYGSIIQPFTPILGRIDSKQIEAMIESSKESMAQQHHPHPTLPWGGLEGSPRPQRHPHPGPLPPAERRARAALPPPPLVGGRRAQRGGRGVRRSRLPVLAEVCTSPNPSPSRGGAQAPSAAGPAVISIDDFAKLDLRIGKVLQCEFVEGFRQAAAFRTRRRRTRQAPDFFRHPAAYQEPAKLVGRHVVFIANSRRARCASAYPRA
jgi:methionyl-tRNA synthetase